VHRLRDDAERLCADDDYRTAGNPGLTKANEAAFPFGDEVELHTQWSRRPASHTA